MPNYPGISSQAFRHPLDAQAEQTLRSVPGFDLVARKFMELVYERPRLVYLMGNAVEVNARQYASLDRLFQDCVRALDVSPQPTLFVSQSPAINAYALGQEKPCVVVTTAMLDLLSETELRVAIAHELGHVKCGHTTLIQMARWAMMAIAGLAEMTFGISALVSSSLVTAFYEWLRKAELSADRAALLVTDDVQAVFRCMMQISGGSRRYAQELDLQEFLRQAERYQALDQDGLNQVYKFFLYNNLSDGSFQTHPFTVERVHFIDQWARSTEYADLRAGNYPRTAAGTGNDPGNTPGHENHNSSTSSTANPATPSDHAEVERLRREVAALQEAIDQIRRSQSM